MMRCAERVRKPSRRICCCSRKQRSWTLSILLICSTLLLFQHVRFSLPTPALVRETEAIESIELDPVLRQMEELELFSSMRHYTKYKMNSRRVKHDPRFNSTHFFSAGGGNFAAFRLNDEYAFYHIFKNGGTTIEKQTGRKQMNDSEAQQRYRRWVVTLRDPLDHFLSGWRECGERLSLLLQSPTLDFVESEYDGRVLQWFDLVENYAANRSICDGKVGESCECAGHSFPQANFLLANDMGDFYPNVYILGCRACSGLPTSLLIRRSRRVAMDPRIGTLRTSPTAVTCFPSRQ